MKSKSQKHASNPPLQPQVFSVPSPIWLRQSPWFFIISSILLSALIAFTNLSRRDGRSWLDDLTNGMPVTGELGLGRFLINGVTAPFEYPFRLLHREFISAALPWFFYLAHQTGQFWILTTARAAKQRGEIDWTDGYQWNPYAWEMLKLNVCFILIHYLHTQFYYDGLAATFPEISTLFAGVSPLIAAYILDIRRRGLFFTWTPLTGRKLIEQFSQFIRDYHGYLASFGITITFWYHCFESTFAHATGFAHIFLLLWQSSLLYQRAHRNRYWTVTLEMWIIIHAFVVSYFQDYPFVNVMFGTSFLFLFIMGPIWGLPFINTHVVHHPDRKRFYAMLVGLLGVYLPFASWCFWKSTGSLLYVGMVLGLPVLYYGFMFYYFSFYVAGRTGLNALVSTKLIKVNGKVYYTLVVAWSTLTVALILFLGEFVYRQFVPYNRPH